MAHTIITLNEFESDLLKQMLASSIENAKTLLEQAKDGMIEIGGQQLPCEPVLLGANMAMDIYERLEAADVSADTRH